MSSAWVQFRDAVEADVENMKLGEEAKQELTKNLALNVMPAVDAWIGKLSAGLIEESKEETGWCKIRDAVVLPYALRAITYVGKQALAKTMEKTVTA